MRGRSCFAFVSLVLSVVAAQGVGIGYVNDSNLLPGSRFKFAVVEYESPRESRWGAELSRILTQELIGSVRRIPGVGVVNLEQATNRLSMTLDAVRAIAQRQKAAVVIWGEIFEAGSNLHLHSHLSMFPSVSDTNQSLDLVVETPGGIVRAQPPTFLVNFAPIQIPIDSVAELQKMHQEANTLRVEPNPRAAESGQVHPQDTYSVIAIAGPWMKIRLARGISGWVRYANLEFHPKLRDLKSIVLFAQGVMHYFAGNYHDCRETLDGYLKLYGDGQDAINRASAQIVLATAVFKANRFEESVPRNENVSKIYLQAAALLPNQAAPINYVSAVRLKKYAYAEKYAPEMRDLEKRLIQAIQNEGHPDSIENLRVLYRLAASTRFLDSGGSSPAVYTALITNQLGKLDRLNPRSTR